MKHHIVKFKLMLTMLVVFLRICLSGVETQAQDNHVLSATPPIPANITLSAGAEGPGELGGPHVAPQAANQFNPRRANILALNWEEQQPAGVTYTLWISKNKDFDPPFFIRKGIVLKKDKSKRIDANLRSGVTYYWKVDMVDADGKVLRSSEALSFEAQKKSGGFVTLSYRPCNNAPRWRIWGKVTKNDLAHTPIAGASVTLTCQCPPSTPQPPYETPSPTTSPRGNYSYYINACCTSCSVSASKSPYRCTCSPPSAGNTNLNQEVNCRCTPN